MVFRGRTTNPDERKVYVHDEIEIEYRGIKAKINKDGKVTLRHDDPNSDEYDEIVVPANLIFKLTNLLNNTRKVRFEPKET